MAHLQLGTPFCSSQMRQHGKSKDHKLLSVHPERSLTVFNHVWGQIYNHRVRHCYQFTHHSPGNCWLVVVGLVWQALGVACANKACLHAKWLECKLGVACSPIGLWYTLVAAYPIACVFVVIHSWIVNIGRNRLTAKLELWLPYNNACRLCSQVWIAGKTNVKRETGGGEDWKLMKAKANTNLTKSDSDQMVTPTAPLQLALFAQRIVSKNLWLDFNFSPGGTTSVVVSENIIYKNTEFTVPEQCHQLGVPFPLKWIYKLTEY